MSTTNERQRVRGIRADIQTQLEEQLSGTTEVKLGRRHWLYIGFLGSWKPKSLLGVACPGEVRLIAPSPYEPPTGYSGPIPLPVHDGGTNHPNIRFTREARELLEKAEILGSEAIWLRADYAPGIIVLQRARVRARGSR